MSVSFMENAQALHVKYNLQTLFTSNNQSRVVVVDCCKEYVPTLSLASVTGPILSFYPQDVLIVYKRQRTPKGQPRMENPETRATLGTFIRLRQRTRTKKTKTQHRKLRLMSNTDTRKNTRQKTKTDEQHGHQKKHKTEN